MAGLHLVDVHSEGNPQLVLLKAWLRTDHAVLGECSDPGRSLCTFQTSPLAGNQPFPDFCPFIPTTSAPTPSKTLPPRVNLKAERPRCAVCRSLARDLFDLRSVPFADVAHLYRLACRPGCAGETYIRQDEKPVPAWTAHGSGGFVHCADFRDLCTEMHKSKNRCHLPLPRITKAKDSHLSKIGFVPQNTPALTAPPDQSGGQTARKRTVLNAAANDPW
jgi:hypothetical protein